MAEPEYTAVRLWLPEVLKLVVSVALPELSVAVPSVVLPLLKVMVPVAVLGETVAVAMVIGLNPLFPPSLFSTASTLASTIALQFQDAERTLTENEVQELQARMVAAVATECGGRLRER